MLVQTGFCRTCSETTLLVFPLGGSYITGSFCDKMTLFTVMKMRLSDRMRLIFITYLVTFYWIILITHTTYSFFSCVTSEQHKKIFGNCVTHRIHKASDNIHDKYSTVLFFNFQIPAVIH